jgi:hypothetical protein
VASPKPPPAPTQPPPALPEPTVRHTGDSVRTNPDGSYHIADGGDGCTYVEVHRSLLPLGPDQDPAPGAVLSVTLQSYDCHDGYYHYTPSTGELTGFLP